MKRTLIATACALALAACQDAAPTGPAAAPAEANAALLGGGGLIEPALSSLLHAAAPTDRLIAIVNFDPAKTTSATLAGRLRTLGAGVVRFEHLSMVAVLASPAQILSAAALPGVEGVYDNGVEKLLLRESVASIRADVAHTAGFTGKGIGVAIMDSGINGLNPDVPFPSKTVANVKFTLNFQDLLEDDGTPRFGGELFIENLPNTDATSGHGTHVAGIVAGTGGSTYGTHRGVAPGANLIGLSLGEATAVVNVSILQGADWLIENRARYNIQVVNCSWGSNGEFDPKDPVNEAMSALHDAGITVVFAAGNEGPDQNTMNLRSANPDVISVAAGCKLYVLDGTNSQASCLDANGRPAVLAGFSSRGVPGDPIWHPDVTAPGVNIVSTRAYTGAVSWIGVTSDAGECNVSIQNFAHYTCMSGTSMAAPHVAGVVALMEEASNGKITPDQALMVLQNTARPIPGYAHWEVGTGFVDAYAAALAAQAYR
ncbi:MAG TPA: S8 family serine peptidase [Longimicrobium sp.]|nr:S8 family serine peptidase [Longimicrobium sp.]